MEKIIYFRTTALYPNFEKIATLCEILRIEFPGAKHFPVNRTIHFMDREDLLAFILKYGHIYGPK